MGKLVEQSCQETGLSEVEWHDATGWTPEMRDSILLLIRLWEITYGYAEGDPSEVLNLL